MVNKRSPWLIGVIFGVCVVLLAAAAYAYSHRRFPGDTPSPVSPTPVPAPINVLPIAKRPFVTLQPLSARNELELIIHHVPQPADSVEVTLEYDRNQGVLDAVLKQFPLATIPLVEKLFLGSKSAGGHITYHDDVIGGDLTLKFSGAEPYTLKVPWRYDDTQKQYSQLSSADGFFQVDLAKPITQPKVLVMQSPGAPPEFPGEVIAGPYLVRTVGPLPLLDATVKVRLPQEQPEAQLYAWDEDSWLKLEASHEGKTLTATGPLYSVYAVAQ